ncbi:ribokinase [Granulicella sp. 5B5]|uniref:ribokinase n=1 Tax=Granulicella sp. 5B5 TaxID=1617967 RepID=UPI0015F63F3D|nr:ribokinase [Granulicella sp. 5B5]QMV18151.1 ribokinase [Granulicella sp. 5B5]
MAKTIVVLGSFVADVAFRMGRLPAWGETVLGSGLALGPGGKGSNQAVAAARALQGSGARVRIASRVGDDAFGQIAHATWEAAGVEASLVDVGGVPTGSAAILIDEVSGNNAIVVVPGACYTLTPEDVDRMAEAIRGAKVLLVQLELPLATVQRGLEIARAAGVTTILNPAPAVPLSEEMLSLVDYLTPNESEAALLTGLPVETVEQAEVCARALLERGPKVVILTLGERGAIACARGGEPVFVPAFHAGPVVETTGAGDAFCGGFAAALLEGKALSEAVRFGCATAGISVTRAGTAPSMPQRAEIEALLRG